MKDGRDHIATSKMKASKVVSPGAFKIAVIGLVHGHVYSLVSGLLDAGATLDCVYDEDHSKALAFVSKFGGVRIAPSVDAILSDSSIALVVNCVRPDVRASMSIRALESGKDVFSDKPGFLKASDYFRLKDAVAQSGKHYLIYFSEHFHCEGMIKALDLVSCGKIGKVMHYESFGPHRLNPTTRPDWFFDVNVNGSVLLDLGCHLVEQFMCLTGSHADDISIEYARSLNLCHPSFADFCDFGEILLRTSNGVSGYVRVDWLTPDGLPTWGDGRAFISGSDGYIEVRKYIDVGHGLDGDLVVFVDNSSEKLFEYKDKVGFDFFGKLILDCMKGTFAATDYSLSLDAMYISALAEKKALH